ncbi:MAG: YccF domain-containing protein [Massilibacteroides sp.]|nr:YccF domain-containing protein [Massilibacteroides sp.]
MNFIGNILWLIFGGFATAIEYFLSSIAMMLTIIGIPFGIQTLKLGLLALWPFGSKVKEIENSTGCLSIFMNIIWFFIGGFWIALTHLFFGVLLYCTIIGIPWGNQHFKMMALALSPFGKVIV